MKRILIVDDHDVVRAGIITLAAQLDLDAGEAGTPAQALEMINKEHWDLAIIDLSLGALSGLSLLRELKQIRPSLPALVLTMHGEEQYARRAYRDGASGFITKDSPRSELLRAIRRILDGGKYVSPEIAEKLVLSPKEDPDRPPHWSLSDRELEVMRLIAAGKTVGEIAGLLSLSAKTISTYRSRILDKMHFASNADIIAYALRNKLTS